jgi:hypothetical protein
VARFRIDLESHAIVEAFGADLEVTRSLPGETGAELRLPTACIEGEAGVGWVSGFMPYDELRSAALAAGGRPRGDPRPDVPGALRRFGRMASAEVEAVCDLPGPRANAELWRLAAEWRVKPVRVLTGMLWEPA